MKYSLRKHSIALVVSVCMALILLPTLVVILLSTYIASIPSKVGTRVPVGTWIRQGMDGVFDFELMRRFRDDIFYRTKPYLELTDDFDRWWILREMELSIERTDSALQSGEYVIAILFAVGSLTLDSTFYGVSVTILLTFLAIAFSGLVIIRIVAIDTLVFSPEPHLEEPTQDLAFRMAFNRGPMSQGSSIAIALLTLFIGLSRGTGYEVALEVIEWFAERSHPDNGERWMVSD